MDELKKPQVMMPGDQITINQNEPATKTVKLGPGLLLLPPASSSSSSTYPPDQDQQLIVTRLGLHGHTQSASAHQQQLWIQGRSKRYVAALGDPVIGIVIAKHAEGYRVDIGTSQPASLDALAFEGATKRTKPNLKIGAVVYARVSLALNHTETEIECINPANQKSDGFGEMTEGMLVRHLDLAHCKQLLSPPYKLLSKIGATQKFEISIGMNGRIWCKSNSISNTIKILQQIQRPT
ncbi:exosome non-catalytic core subunit rrp40 [Puccinia graminis f. sp. tritici]|uniref:Ribosomal RNA-processing protein 40 n=1 Tax=Puccinia graminis f. sp. tritici TaxID=56615 RepID=A0A5B0NVE0_PUCGR|nr:exosome non-catalytic core subunit rrp40 [Puccinia graminis f. sp. tritici]KAA1105159.1 exosome non-catalytic core subunit rrp40 [Puccinia graminis f. sp. tritici]